LALSVITGVLVGLVPAFQQAGRDLRSGLSESSRGASDGRGRARLRVSLVAVQIAMALIVLVGAGLLGRSFQALQRVKPGFIADDVLSMTLTVPRVKYDSNAKVIRFFQQLVTQASAVPGAAEVSAGYPVPMAGDGWSGSFNVEGEPDGPNDPEPH